MYDFGFCAMDILQAVSEDSGTYEVRATNRLGTATSSITIAVKRKCLKIKAVLLLTWVYYFCILFDLI